MDATAGKRGQFRRRAFSRLRGWVPWIVFVAVALGGLSIAFRIRQLENAHQTSHFADVAGDRATLLDAAIQTAVRPVQHIASLFAQGDGTLTDDQFQRDARSLPLAQEPRLSALQWIPLERGGGRDAFIVRYSFSAQPISEPVGFDLLTDPVVGPWLRETPLHEGISFSPWYVSDGEIFIRAFHPVLKQGRDGRRTLVGMVSAVYRMDHLLQAAWAAAPETGIEIWITREGATGVIRVAAGIASYAEAQPPPPSGSLHRSESIEVPGGRWQLLLVAPPGLFPHTPSSLIIGIAMLISGFLLALYLRDLQNRQDVISGLVVQRTRSLNERTQELETVYRSAPVGLAVLDRELRFVRVNDRLAQLNGLALHEHTGKRLEEVVPWIADAAHEIGSRVIGRGEALQDVEFRGAAMERGEPERFFNTHWLPLRDDAARVWGINLVVEETTERRRLEEQARHLAEHDPLTDLPNRRLLVELIRAALQTARRTQRKVALLFLDLDNFKSVNDTLGHEGGDALLKAVAARILSRVRRSDLVARLGGDEFTVLLSDLSRAEQAGELADEIVHSVQFPFNLVGQTLYLTTSVGISLFPDDSDTAEGLLRRADLAMYDAKEKGRNNFRFYNPNIDRRARERARIAHTLHEALARGDLLLLYQPEIDLRTGRMVGVEALVRWRHPELGMLDPERFIPVAEETDLIIALDEWVLRTACNQAQQWTSGGQAAIKVAVNLSAKGFEHPSFIDTVRSRLAESGLAPGCLELELTERTVMRRTEQTIPRMRELVALGVGISVDDFGTGYSSLSYLKRLPIGKLKIDRSFVRDIATDADDRAIVQAVTALAHTLNKRVIAEGVETSEQREFLYASGCDEAQGFLYDAPLPPERISELLAH